MGIEDLDQGERLVLGGLIRLMVRSDGDFAAEEESTIDALGAPIGGREAIWKLISDSAQAYPDENQIRAAVPRIEREEAQKIMLEIVTKVAEPGDIVAAEQQLIDWLRQVWS